MSTLVYQNFNEQIEIPLFFKMLHKVLKDNSYPPTDDVLESCAIVVPVPRQQHIAGLPSNCRAPITAFYNHVKEGRFKNLKLDSSDPKDITDNRWDDYEYPDNFKLQDGTTCRGLTALEFYPFYKNGELCVKLIASFCVYEDNQLYTFFQMGSGDTEHILEDSKREFRNISSYVTKTNNSEYFILSENEFRKYLTKLAQINVKDSNRDKIQAFNKINDAHGYVFTLVA